MRTDRVLTAMGVALLSLGWLSGALVGPALGASCGGSFTTLQDGGFETPVIAAGGNQSLDASLVPPWQTTDSKNQIEIWGSGFLGVPAAVGAQFVEINANTAGTLYQDVVTTPGDKMTWTLQHRGRSGTDVMKVLIGDSTTADVNSDTGWGYFSPDLSDGNTAWGTHTGMYTVPAGQTCTRFGFRAVSSAGGDPSFGNFLDDAGFQIAATPSPSPSASAVIRPTPPVTATSPSESGGAGGSPVVLVALTVIGLAVAGWRMARTSRRTGA